MVYSGLVYCVVYSLKETCVLFCVLHSFLVFIFYFSTSFLFKFSVLILTATFIKNIGLITKLYPFYMQVFVYFLDLFVCILNILFLYSPTELLLCIFITVGYIFECSKRVVLLDFFFIFVCFRRAVDKCTYILGMLLQKLCSFHVVSAS